MDGWAWMTLDDTIYLILDKAMFFHEQLVSGKEYIKIPHV
jgi:hypothetical protein